VLDTRAPVCAHTVAYQSLAPAMHCLNTAGAAATRQDMQLPWFGPAHRLLHSKPLGHDSALTALVPLSFPSSCACAWQVGSRKPASILAPCPPAETCRPVINSLGLKKV
jgi:hypothetical protein